MEKWDLPGIASLLQNSPYVETLVIDIIFSNHDLEFLDRIYDEVNHWKSKEVYFKSLLQCLKTVKIFGFGERFHTKDVFILVVEFLLKNAKVDQLSLCLSAPHLNPYGNDGYTLPQRLYADEFVSELDFHFCETKPKGDEEEEVRKDSVEVVSELLENLHQVKKLIVGKWCLKRHECINVI
nr:hypothetical protein CFP56_67414 [Quercus suber]